MIELTGTETLADLMTVNPSRTRVLEGFHFDYCYNGARSRTVRLAPLTSSGFVTSTMSTVTSCP